MTTRTDAPTTDEPAFEDALIEDMRAHGGEVTSGPLEGHPLLVMTSTGASSGETRRAILTFSRDDGDYIVAGSAGGAPSDPAWVENVRKQPRVSIEAGDRTFEASAHIVEGEERDRLWEQHVARLPHFADYPTSAGRPIPMIRITPSTS